MIKHIVSYKLKDSSLESRQETKNVLMSMNGKIEVIRDIKVGIDILSSERSYDIVLEMIFDNLDDLKTYKNHEYHLFYYLKPQPNKILSLILQIPTAEM